MVNDEDHFPQTICPSCENRLRENYNFHLMVTNNQNKLKELMLEIETPSTNEEILCEIITVTKLNKKSEKPKRVSGFSARYSSKTQEEIDEEDKKLREFFDLSCSHCPSGTKTFDSLINLQNHMKTTHNIEKPALICCNKRLAKRSYLWQHYLFHTNPETLQCSHCEYQSSNSYALNLHITRKHIENGKYVCDICNKKFSCSVHLQKHLKVHLTEEEKDKIRVQNTCVECGMRFLSKSNLNAHLNTQHNHDQGKTRISYGQKKTQCATCSEWFVDATGLKRHIANRHENKPV